MFSLPRISAACFLLGFAGLGGASGCLYDSSNRCDPGQSYDSGSGLCICAPSSNSVTGDHGCVACGTHEIAVNDACTCEPGYQKPSGGTTCQIVPDGLGDACTADTDCTVSPLFNSCHPSSASGYCTNVSCTTDDDCAGGYACNTTATPSYCQRPPTGQAMPCTSSADCDDFEASYCLTIMANACFVECSLTGDDCFSGWQCCDLPTISLGLIPKTLCVPTGTCHR